MEDPSKVIQEVDLYHSFIQQGLLRPYNPDYYINFWEYYEAHNGWNADKLP